MKKVIKYTGDKTFMFPTGGLATPEIVAEQYPAVTAFTHIVETDDNCEVLFAIQNLSAMRNIYNIDASLTEDEAIAKIEEIVNTPEPESTEVTAEERIAAALEYQVMASLPDEEASDAIVTESEGTE